ncbi:MAG: hypothetical protein JJ919_00025 [Henriciella sp.]|nr:hypothetical protein [Henriciella sp.]
MPFAFSSVAFRLITAMIIACVFLYAPVAEAEHLETVTEITCNFEHSLQKTDKDQPNQGDHDHHANHSGPCLQHLLRKDWNQDSFICASEGAHIPLLSVSLLSRPPGSLYRPPRA